MKTKFYSLSRILERNAHYNIIFGERSNGKTWAVQEYIIRNFVKTGEQAAVLRRWDIDFKGQNGANYFKPLDEIGLIEKLTKGQFNTTVYKSQAWFFGMYDEKTSSWITPEKPFAYAYAITAMEHNKGGGSGSGITTILFDEFITRSRYAADEFALFTNTLSTIIRQRDNVKIFMLGNTVNKYSCLYYSEMGLTNISKMNVGDIDVYNYGDSGLRVAVEFSDGVKNKKSNVYFAFNNPKLQMITGGAWEMGIYPHAPCKWLPKDILFTYYIKFLDNIMQCEIVKSGNMFFTFVHKKTTPIKEDTAALIYSTEYNAAPNYRRKITKPRSELEKRIAEFFVTEKVYYSDNDTGELMRNYINYCHTDKTT